VAQQELARRGARRYEHDSPEFARVANLSDAVFAIAMTLLVLTLDVPEVGAEGLAAALADRLPQLAAVVLSFALVASVWWSHHKFMGLLGSVEPGMIALNLAFLGGVALVPFPTALIGNTPTARAAAVSFVALFVLLLLLFLLIVLRAQAVGAWRRPMPEGLFPWVRAYWVLATAGMTLALLIALWIPLAGLAAAFVNGFIVAVVLILLGPPEFQEWT
jgi:uncharacterized membrane protein